MSSALLALIKSIEQQPADEVLVDRFIVLVEGCPQPERSTFLTKIAKTVASALPRRAIEIAFKEFRAPQSPPVNIAVIVDALEKMNMSEKSAIIRKLAMRYWNKQLSTDDRNLAKLAIEEHLTRILLQPSIMTPLHKSKDDEERDQNLFPERNFDGLPLSLLGANLEQQPYMGRVPLKNMEPADSAPDLGPRPVLEALPATIFSIAEEALPSKIVSFGEETPQHEIRARISVSNNQDGIPQMIAAPDVSRQSRGLLESALRGTPEFDGKYEGRPPAGKLSADEVKALIASEDWEGLLVKLMVDLRLGADVQFLMTAFEKHNLQRIDIRFAGRWIDILVAGGQERRALRYIQRKLIEEESLTWARVCWPKIQTIRNRLELTDFDWRESDGVAALRNRVNELRPKLFCYLVAQQKVS